MTKIVKLTIVVVLIPFMLNGKYILKNIDTKPIYEVVTVTTYTTITKETDSTPLVTANGFKLDSLNPKKHRIIAVSRDLKRKWKFGTKVRILNAGKYSGIYYVKDLMNKRWKSRIDILINPKDRQTKLYNIKIVKI